MAYRDFKTQNETAEKLGLSLQTKRLFHNVQTIEPTAVLNEALEFGLSYSPASEKARNEWLVTPILAEIIRYHAPEYSVVSGVELNVDSEKGLKGFVDFIICRAPKVFYLKSPLVAILEAKKGDIEAGIGQAMAEMTAIRLYNQKQGVELTETYGCVTNGEIWRFLCLTDNDVYLDEKRYSLEKLNLLLGVWKHILTKENN